MSISFRSYVVMTILVCILSAVIIAALDDPGYTDAYYYYNAGAKLADGDGLTDAYLWQYINAPDTLPTESHRYWMPLVSLVVAVPMAIFGSGFDVAQWAFVPFLMGLVWAGMWLGARIGGTRRHMWVAGLSVLAGGFYFPFWLTSDTFAVFGLVGAVALIALGLGRETGHWRWFALAGVCSGLAHLARADGLLFVIVGIIVIWFPRGNTASLQQRFTQTLALVFTYFIVMLPWFLRTMDVLGTPLPAGGIETAYLRGYNDLFSYPAGWSLQHLLDWGMGNVLKSRLEGLWIAFQTWLGVEGVILLAPFALWSLWKRRRDGFLAPMIWYALGLHLAMSLVFTYPGSRGGLFHSSAALFPFWIALGLVGVDDFVNWIATKRHWRKGEAQMVFGFAVIFVPILLGFTAWSAQRTPRYSYIDYDAVKAAMPANARIMVNDPARWNYKTGLIAVTLPDEPLETALEIAERYCIGYLVIDHNVTDAFAPLIKGEVEPPDFLFLVQVFDGGTPDPDDWNDDVQIYAFDLDCSP